MLATVATKPALGQRVKLMVVAALFTLSLGLGVATTAQQVGAQGVSTNTVKVCYKDPGLGMVCTVIK